MSCSVSGDDRKIPKSIERGKVIAVDNTFCHYIYISWKVFEVTDRLVSVLEMTGVALSLITMAKTQITHWHLLSGKQKLFVRAMDTDGWVLTDFLFLLGLSNLDRISWLRLLELHEEIIMVYQKCVNFTKLSSLLVRFKIYGLWAP